MFEIGRTYNRRRDLHDKYGGQQQGGISTPSDHPYLFIFLSNHGRKIGYEDGWDENGTFNVSGEGQRGDMTFVRGNLALRDHIKNSIELHLFQSIGNGGNYRYVGEFACMSWSNKVSKDIEAQDRQAIIFHLTPALNEIATSTETEDIQSVSTLAGDTTLRESAYAAAGSARRHPGKDARREYMVRSKAVSDYVLTRSKGLCELCSKPAPFIRSSDNSPYLEPHHIDRLSDGGPDHPAHVAAVCPNCHREAHSGLKAEAIKQTLSRKILAIEKSLNDIPAGK